MDKEIIYLDNASSTMLSGEVLNAMLPVMTSIYGNMSDSSSFGDVARKCIEDSKKTIAETINAKYKEIYFTSCGSEANSWAIVGIANANRNRGNHIIVSEIEHTSILEACKFLENDGFEISYLPVDRNGFINFTELLRAIKPSTILISIMAANNEIGTIQNIKAISQTAHEKGIIFHTDAIQLYGNMDLDVEDLGIDAMSISGHKIYGPTGIGALYVSKSVKISPIVFGENQEEQKRGGTPNVSGIVGLAKACEIAYRDLRTNNHKVRGICEYFITNLTNHIENVIINANIKQKVPHIISVTFVGVNAESLVAKLNMNNVIASACVVEPKKSRCLTSIGLDNDNASCVVRFSLGKNNSYEEIDKAIAIISQVVEELREFSSTYGMKIRKRKGDKNV